MPWYCIAGFEARQKESASEADVELVSPATKEAVQVEVRNNHPSSRKLDTCADTNRSVLSEIPVPTATKSSSL